MLRLCASISEMWRRTQTVWTTKGRKEVNETIEILSINTILFTNRRCSIWPPWILIHFMYCLIISCQTFGNIPGISWKTPAVTYIRATRSYCVSTWMTPLATDGLNVETQQPGPLADLTWHHWIFISEETWKPWCRDSHGYTTRFCGTNTRSIWSHLWYAGNLSKSSAWQSGNREKYQRWQQPYWAPSVSE